jgi:hypothetical protein
MQQRHFSKHYFSGLHSSPPDVIKAWRSVQEKDSLCPSPLSTKLIRLALRNRAIRSTSYPRKIKEGKYPLWHCGYLTY